MVQNRDRHRILKDNSWMCITRQAGLNHAQQEELCGKYYSLIQDGGALLAVTMEQASTIFY